MRIIVAAAICAVPLQVLAASAQLCETTSKLYGDVANARDLGLESRVVRETLLNQQEAVRRLGGPENVSKMLDYMLEAVYGHPDVSPQAWEARILQLCLARGR